MALPTALFRWTMSTATTVLSVPGRVLDLLSATESVVAKADELVRRTERTVAHAERVTAAAEVQVTAAARLTKFLEEFSAHELEAAIKLVDELPRLAGHLADDVLPILGTLDRVGPDIHELLEVANDVRQAILGIPGFEYLRRRGEGKDEDTQD